MNRDQTEGATKDKPDKTQRKAGKAAGSSDRNAKSVAKQTESRMLKASDDMKAALKHSRHS